jgi:ribosomal protein S1
VSLKNDRSQIGVCILHGLSPESEAVYRRYNIGDEIDVKVISFSKKGGKFVLTQAKLPSV